MLMIAIAPLAALPSADAVVTFCITPDTMPPISHGPDCPGSGMVNVKVEDEIRLVTGLVNGAVDRVEDLLP